MPYVGLTSFLRVLDKFSVGDEVVCQCPMSGLPHFYPGYSNCAFVKTACQCPMSGLPHFYGYCWLWSVEGRLCQCPMSGLPHFYERLSWNYQSNLSLCQCPMSGLPHFYAIEATINNKEMIVSMPYVGLTSFLPWVLCKGCNFESNVSMPYVGLTSFLRRMVAWARIPALCVNALCRAYLISTKSFLDTPENLT